jgi:hypothetical protein
VALLLRIVDPETVVDALGSKVTLIEQLAPGPSTPVLLPLGMQLLLTSKLAPLETIDVMVTEVDRILVTSITCGELGLPISCAAKVRLPGDTARASLPLPLRLTVCGLPLALSLTDRTALCAPMLCGVKVTEIAQLAPAASELPHVLVWENWAFEVAIPDMATAVVSLLVTVKEAGALLLLTAWLGKLNEFGETVTPVPVPLRLESTLEYLLKTSGNQLRGEYGSRALLNVANRYRRYWAAALGAK